MYGENEPDETEIENARAERVELPENQARTLINSQTARKMAELSKGVPRKKKALYKIFTILDRELSKTLPKGSVPVDAQKVGLTHYLTARKLVNIGLRQNEVQKFFTCTKCGHELRVKLPDYVSEEHSIRALDLIYSRMAPKLGSLHVDIKSEHEVEQATTIMADIITKYVPEENRMECLKEIQMQLIKARDDSER